MFEQTSFNKNYIANQPFQQSTYQDYLNCSKQYHNDYEQESLAEGSGNYTPFIRRRSNQNEMEQSPSNIRSSGNEQSNQFEIDMNLFKNKITNDNDENQGLDDQSQFQHDKLQDSFLKLVQNHLHKLKKQQDQSQTSNLTPELISLSKQQLSHCLLQNQTITNSLEITNLSPQPVNIKVINSPFEFRINNANNKFIRKDCIQIQLDSFRTVELLFEIKRRLQEIGNVYETMTVEAFQQDVAISSQNTSKLTKIIDKNTCQRVYVKFEITFVKPKFQLNFLGKTIVKRIQEHKIPLLELYPNEINEYSLALTYSQQKFTAFTSDRLSRIQCLIDTKGYVSVHPSSIVLYQNEPTKLILRRLTQLSGNQAKTSVILIKPLNSSLTYVIGVKLMQRKKMMKKETNDNDDVHMNNFRLY